MKKALIILAVLFAAASVFAAQQQIKGGGGMNVQAKQAITSNFTELYQSTAANAGAIGALDNSVTSLQGTVPVNLVNSSAAAVQVNAEHAAAWAYWLTTNAATTTYTLPPAAPGMRLCFGMGQGNSQILRINPDDADYIVLATGARTSAAGDYVGATASAGNRICLAAYDETYSYITYSNGTWAEE